MGVAIITPDANFADCNLGKVTLTDDVPVRALSIVAQDSVCGTSYQLGVSYYPINTNERGITWSIESGSDYASVSSSGLLSIKDTATSLQEVVVKVKSTARDVSATKTIKVKYDGGKPEPEPVDEFEVFYMTAGDRNASNATSLPNGEKDRGRMIKQITAPVTIAVSAPSPGVTWAVFDTKDKAIIFGTDYIVGTYNWSTSFTKNINNSGWLVFGLKNASGTTMTNDEAKNIIKNINITFS